MAKVTFNADLCKGCGLCVDACPKKIIAIAKDKINAKGHCLRLLRNHVPRLRDYRREMR